jgi:hypothetical protein
VGVTARRQAHPADVVIDSVIDSVNDVAVQGAEHADPQHGARDHRHHGDLDELPPARLDPQQSSITRSAAPYRAATDGEVNTTRARIDQPSVAHHRRDVHTPRRRGVGGELR